MVLLNEVICNDKVLIIKKSIPILDRDIMNNKIIAKNIYRYIDRSIFISQPCTLNGG